MEPLGSCFLVHDSQRLLPFRMRQSRELRGLSPAFLRLTVMELYVSAFDIN